MKCSTMHEETQYPELFTNLSVLAYKAEKQNCSSTPRDKYLIESGGSKGANCRAWTQFTLHDFYWLQFLFHMWESMLQISTELFLFSFDFRIAINYCRIMLIDFSTHETIKLDEKRGSKLKLIAIGRVFVVYFKVHKKIRCSFYDKVKLLGLRCLYFIYESLVAEFFACSPCVDI